MVSNVKKISLHSTEEFMQGYNEDGDIGYILEVDVKPFLLKKMKVQDCEKLVCHLFEKKLFHIHKSSEPGTWSRGNARKKYIG